MQSVQAWDGIPLALPSPRTYCEKPSKRPSVFCTIPYIDPLPTHCLDCRRASGLATSIPVVLCESPCLALPPPPEISHILRAPPRRRLDRGCSQPKVSGELALFSPSPTRYSSIHTHTHTPSLPSSTILSTPPPPPPQRLQPPPLPPPRTVVPVFRLIPRYNTCHDTTPSPSTGPIMD